MGDSVWRIGCRDRANGLRAVDLVLESLLLVVPGEDLIPAGAPTE